MVYKSLLVYKGVVLYEGLLVYKSLLVYKGFDRDENVKVCLYKGLVGI